MQPLISRSAVNTFMARPLDSFQWMKKQHRDAIAAEIRQMRPRPVFRTDPWLHQLVCFYIGCCYPEFLFLLDMGLGKSKIVLDVFNQRLRLGEARRALILVPRLINHESWANAMLDHSFFEPHCISMSDIEAKFDALMHPPGDVAVIDYQGFALAMCSKTRTTGKKMKMVPDPQKIRMVQQVYDFAVLDELHKISKGTSMWYDLLQRTLASFRAVYGLTGTLFNRDVLSLYAPYSLIDRGQTFGETDTLFKSAFFTPETSNFGTKLVFNRSMVLPLNRMIGHRSIRYADREVMDLPALRVQPPVRFHMSEETRTHFLRAVEGVINAGDRSGKKSAYVTMRQVSAGYLAWEDTHGKHRVEFKEQPKLDYLEAMLDRLDGHKLLISHEYTETGISITKRLTKLGVKHVWIHGGVKDPIGLKVQFCEDSDTRVCVMNSEAGGTGVDGLQKVCQHLLFYETPTGPTARQQMVKRLHRPGQLHRVYVTDMVLGGSTDVRILEDVLAGKDFFDRVMEGSVPRGSFFG